MVGCSLHAFLSVVATSFASSVAQCGCNLVMEDRPGTCRQVD